MLKVLLFIIDKYPERHLLVQADPQGMVTELKAAGFGLREIAIAVRWLEGMKEYEANVDICAAVSHEVVRIYDESECEVLDEDCRGFVLHLEQCHILDPVARELVIDRLLALRQEITVSDVQWVVLMVLFHLPDRKPALTAMQDFILASAPHQVH